MNLWLQRLLNEAYEQDLANPDENDLFHLSDLDDFMNDDVFMQSSVDLESQTDGRNPTPLLDKYGRDLTEQARARQDRPGDWPRARNPHGGAHAGRNKKNNPLLLGDSGVGKTAVIEGLAYEIAYGTAPKFLLSRRVIGLEIGMLVAGTSLRGQFEERIVGIVDEAKNAPDVILFIDEIHTIVGAGDTIDSNLDAANILKPALARGEIVCIGATTLEEYRQAIAKDPALDRRFRTIDIQEQSVSRGAGGGRARLASATNCITESPFCPETRDAAVRLSDRYMPDRRLPDKALDLLDEACARQVIQTAPRSPDEDREQSLQKSPSRTSPPVLREWTGIPVSDLTTRDERQRSRDMVDRAAAAGRRAGRSGGSRRRRDQDQPRRAGRPESPGRRVPVSGTERRRQDRTGESALAEFLFDTKTP